VPSTVIDRGGVSAGQSQPRRLKALVFLPSIAYYRMFESLLGAMLAAGHQVLVALDHDRRGLPPDKAHLLTEHLPRRTGPWRIAASAIRRSLDYLRYLEPEYATAEPLREQARNHAPRAFRALLFLPPFRWELGRRPLAWLLRRVEAGIPRPGAVKSFISGQSPDVVLVSSLAELGSAQADYVRSAAAATIPSVLMVAREDDLTSKGVIRDVPTLTVTSSQTGVNEMVRFHGFPRERIVAVGAERSNGRQAPATPGALDAIERAARMEVVAKREGRLLRPVLWLLTPLLAVVLVLLRPRASGRAAIKALRRLAGRIRKRVKTLGRARAERSKAASNEHKLARAQAKAQRAARVAGEKQPKAGRAKAVRANLAKQAGTPPRTAAKEDTVARGDARNGGENASADAAEETETGKPRG
jgi:hypothetical protein